MNVDADPRAAARRARNRYVDRAERRIEQVPEPGGTEMTESTFSAGQHRGHKAPLLAEMSVTDGVDAAMDAVQTANPGAMEDTMLRDSRCAQLSDRNDAMLTLDQARNHSIVIGAFPRHIAGKAPMPLGSPPFGLRESIP